MNEIIRENFPVLKSVAYLNTGASAPISSVQQSAYGEYLTGEIEGLTKGASAYEVIVETKNKLRGLLANILGCSEQEVALMHSTTEGINTFVMGIDWHNGDEIVTALTEHPGVTYPVSVVAARYGCKVVWTRIGFADVDPYEELQKALTDKTKLVVLSHVTWTTGMILPIARLAELAHQAGSLFLGDGAQSVGMISVNVKKLGVDGYACSGHKWLCGPMGTGALYVAQDVLPQLAQTFASYASGSFEEGYRFKPAESAKRFEAISLNPASIYAFYKMLTWETESVSWQRIFERILELRKYCYEKLNRIDGVRMLSPLEYIGGLVHFQIDGMSPQQITNKLQQRGIVIRDTPTPPANRVSTCYFNIESDVDVLVSAIEQIAASRGWR